MCVKKQLFRNVVRTFRIGLNMSKYITFVNELIARIAVSSYYTRPTAKRREHSLQFGRVADTGKRQNSQTRVSTRLAFGIK